MKDIIHKRNIYYNNKDKCIKLKGNTIIVESMHYCYSHAIMDFIFPIFWIMKDILNNYNDDIFNLFIKIPQHPNNYKIISNDKYIGVFDELIKLLDINTIIFEHKIETNVFFENAFYIESDGEWISKWQRGVWNCSYYYPQRLFNINDVYFTDEQIYTNLRDFVKYVKNKYNIKDYKTENEMLIIDRKNDRKFDDDKLTKIINNIPNNINYKIVILEDMSLKEQIELFSSNNIFLFRHGSCLMNLLWIQEKSIIYDLDHQCDRPNIIKRICQLTNSSHKYLNYFSSFIFP